MQRASHGHVEAEARGSTRRDQVDQGTPRSGGWPSAHSRVSRQPVPFCFSSWTSLAVRRLTPWPLTLVNLFCSDT